MNVCLSNDAKSIASALVAGATLMAAAAALKHLDLGSVGRLLMALLPLPAYIFFVLIQVKSARQMDELHQRIQLEALVFAFPTAFVGILTTWLLHMAGFLPGLEFTHAVAFFLVLMIFLYAVGRTLAARRYR